MWLLFPRTILISVFFLFLFISIDHKKHVVERVVDPLTASVEMAITQPPVKRMKIYPQDRGMENNQQTLLHSCMLPPSHDDTSPSKHHVLPLTNVVNVPSFTIHSVLIYAKQENEEVFHPLHLVPPSLVGLAVAVSISSPCLCRQLLMLTSLLIQIQNKYKLEAKNIRHIFKRCRKG